MGKTSGVRRAVPVGLFGVGVALALVGAAGPARADADPPGDFLLDCDPSAAPGPGGDPAMDLLDVTDTAGRRGDEHVFVADTNGDLKAYLDGNPESAAVIVRVYDPRTGLVTEVIEERHQGRSRTTAEVDGEPSDIEVKTVIETSQIEFTVTGLELFKVEEWRWSVQTNNLPGDGNFYCDQAGDGPDGKPSLPPAAAAESSTTVTSAPSTTNAAAPSTGTARSPNGDDSTASWWILFLFGGVGVLVLLRFWGRWGEWFRTRGVGGSHGAPETPPPDQNDFGE